MHSKARKRFGQNFLVDVAVVNRIVDAINPQPADHVLEIGPGRGALTELLAASGAELTLVEIDRDLSAILADNPKLAHARLINQDALKINWNDVASGGRLRLVGNLPYNVSTPILFHALAGIDYLQDMHLMLQQEVVQRMASAPGSKRYGRLSVMVQYLCEVEPLFRVAPGAFRPIPKVESAVVRLLPRKEIVPQVRDFSVFRRLVSAAFSQRRKQIRNSLKVMVTPDQLQDVGVSPADRPENLSVEQFVALANAFVEHGGGVDTETES